MRHALWLDAPAAEHQRELDALLAAGSAGKIAFIAVTSTDEAIGFAEASVRHDPVNGCDTNPVTFLEGLYARPAHRRAGLAARLVAAVEARGRSTGCTELGSDADWENAEGLAFHGALGFEETERVVFFRKRL